MSTPNINEQLVIDTLKKDPDFLYLVNYNFINMTFGPDKSFCKGLSLFYSKNPDNTILLLIKALSLGHEALFNHLFDPTQIGNGILKMVCKSIKNELFLAVCIDIFIEKYKARALTEYTTKYCWAASHFTLYENVFYLDDPRREFTIIVNYADFNTIEWLRLADLNKVNIEYRIIGTSPHKKLKKNTCELNKFKESLEIDLNSIS